MRDTIFSVVEGDGEETAAPELVRRILYEHAQHYEIKVHKSYNAHGRNNIAKPGGLEKFLNLNRSRPDCAAMIVLLDAERDDVDCPPCLAGQLAQRARELKLPFPIAIVCAACEYESWFLYNMDAIAEHYGWTSATYLPDPEMECSAKEWLTRWMPDSRIYKETQDQVRMTSALDIVNTMQQSRSFRRMVHAVELLLESIKNGDNAVTPLVDIEDC